MNALFGDLRYAVRVLAKSRGFTAVAVLTLALGIGVNAAIFSLISDLFFRPLPAKNPGGLVQVVKKVPISSFLRGYEYPNYLDIRDRATALSDIIAYGTGWISLAASGSPAERTGVAVVTGNYFSFFGVDAAEGRLFLPGEGERIGADPIVVLAHRYWLRRFGGDRAIVGRTVSVNAHPFTVVGVAPPEFVANHAGMEASVFVPVTMLGHVAANGDQFLQSRAGMPLHVMGRLKPGVSLRQAGVELETIVAQIDKDHPQQSMGGRALVVHEWRARPDPGLIQFTPLASAVFMGLAGLILLIACANVASLTFSRAVVRRQELGIRAALGASRRVLVRQLLAESAALTALASVVGLPLAYWLGQWTSNRLLHFGSSDIPLVGSSWDWRVLVFASVMAALAALLSGLMPALKTSRVDLQAALKEGSGALLGSTGHPLRSILVVSQVAISLVVLICGGVFLQSLRGATPALLGFRSDHMLMASMDLGLNAYEPSRARQFRQQLVERARALPGVEAATLGTFVPFATYSFMTAAWPEGRVVRGIQDATIMPYGLQDPDYIKTMGMTLARGRDFVEQDTASAPPVAIVNEHMAALFWPGQNPLGKRLFSIDGGNPVPSEVVGVVRNGRYKMVGEMPSPFLLRPIAQSVDMGPSTLCLRTHGDPVAIAPALRAVVRQLDPNLPLYDVRTMERHLNDDLFALMPLRVGAALAGIQGLLALALVVMGIYGVVSFVTSRRAREIGIRMALGAEEGDIVRMVLGSGLKLTLTGIAIGAALALGLTAILSRVLYGLAPSSAPIFALVILLLLCVASIACWLPARRAARVNPIETLRAE
jgi:predicted permease